MKLVSMLGSWLFTGGVVVVGDVELSADECGDCCGVVVGSVADEEDVEETLDIGEDNEGEGIDVATVVFVILRFVGGSRSVASAADIENVFMVSLNIAFDPETGAEDGDVPEGMAMLQI
ncbi:hypothetical protein BGZ58_004709 [Dissophora ornata]|nr:hypothetical protein BGZ58_004709 [Dissophora ornata]